MLLQADARHIPLEDETVQCCVTSPPYWGLRDYGLATWEGGDPECEHDVAGQVQDNKAPGAITSGVRPGAGNVCRKCGAVRHDAGIGLEKTPDCQRQGMVRFRRDLPPDRLVYAVQKLRDAGLLDAASCGMDGKD